MFNKTLISFVLFALVNFANADEIKVNPDHPDNYVVVKGDTLWDISAKFLEKPWRWPEIWDVNPQIANPHLIYPGDVISLTYNDGMPVLNINRGSMVNGRNVKLSPKIRMSEHDEAINTIPVDAIQQFLERPLVLDENEIKYWPYVVASYDQRLISATGNKIYIRGLAEDTEDREFSIYRMGKPYINPADKSKKEILGYEAIYVGDAILEKHGDPASAIITSVDREVLNGDRLVVNSNNDISSEFIPRPTASAVNGQILSVVDGVSQIGQYQIIVLNLGKEQGVEPGNVLGIYQAGKLVKDKIGPNIQKTPGEKTENVQLPEEYVGVAMIFRTFNKVSYALVLETKGAAHINDMVRSM